MHYSADLKSVDLDDFGVELESLFANEELLHAFALITL